MKQTDKILKIMQSDPTRWWYPYDFMNPELGNYFVGYKAGTRLSEMAKANPNLFESKKVGKYVVRRIKVANPGIDNTPIATQGAFNIQTNDMRGFR